MHQVAVAPSPYVKKKINSLFFCPLLFKEYLNPKLIENKQSVTFHPSASG